MVKRLLANYKVLEAGGDVSALIDFGTGPRSGSGIRDGVARVVALKVQLDSALDKLEPTLRVLLKAHYCALGLFGREELCEVLGDISQRTYYRWLEAGVDRLVVIINDDGGWVRPGDKGWKRILYEVAALKQMQQLEEVDKEQMGFDAWLAAKDSAGGLDKP
ncbi:MAG: hypothetical protein WA118_08230 [Carboxydocellales bacterium]